MPIVKIGSLQIESSAASQSLLFWRIQKVVIIFLIFFLIAVLLGLTGPGLLNKSVLKNKEGTFWVTYNKFGRANSVSYLQFNVNNTSFTQFNKVKIFISKAYINSQYIKQIHPAPISQETQNDQIIYTFLLAGNSNITFILEPQRMGKMKADIGLGSRDSSVSLTQFFFP